MSSSGADYNTFAYVRNEATTAYVKGLGRRPDEGPDEGEVHMKLDRRTFVRLVTAAASMLPISRIARGEDYPTRPVRIVTPLSCAAATHAFVSA